MSSSAILLFINSGVDLSYVWRMAMPKAATRPMQRALIAHPTEIVRPAPFTAESIWPAMMDAIIPPKTRQYCQFEEGKVKNQNMIKQEIAFKICNVWCTGGGKDTDTTYSPLEVSH